MNLTEMIARGESETLEFKQKTTRPYRISRTLTSLANTHGGHVLVGVDDAGRVVGVRDAEEELFVLRTAAAQHVEPPLEGLRYREVEAEGRTVLVVTVPESTRKPHRAQVAADDWRGYVRVRDQSVQTSRLTEQVLEGRPPTAPGPLFERLPLGRHELAAIEYAQAHPRLTLPQFIKLVNFGKRRAYQTLIKLVLHGYLRYHDKEKEPYYTI